MELKSALSKGIGKAMVNKRLFNTGQKVVNTWAVVALVLTAITVSVQLITWVFLEGHAIIVGLCIMLVKCLPRQNV